MSKKRRMKHVDTDDVDKQEHETDTEDVYDDEQLLKTLSCREENKSPKRGKAKNRKLATTTQCRLNWRKTNTKKTSLKPEPSAKANRFGRYEFKELSQIRT